MKKRKGRSSIGVLFIRILFCSFIVFCSYNPTGISVLDWLERQPDLSEARVLFVAVVAVLINLGLLLAAWRGHGLLGTMFAVTFFGAVAYLFLQEKVIGLTGPSGTWFVLTLYSIYLGSGLSDAILFKRATGQVAVGE